MKFQVRVQVEHFAYGAIPSRTSTKRINIMKPKLIMYVYGDITTDARVNRAATALADKYDVCLLSTNFGKDVKDSNYKNILIGNGGIGMWNLLMNIYEAYKIVRHEKPSIVYCHDYYSAILAFLLKSRKYCKHIVYDAHELIIPEPDVRDRRLAFFQFFEKSIIKKVDKVFCASKERGAFMRKHYNLSCTPIPIRNISQLIVNNDRQTQTIVSSLDDFFSKPGPVVVYAGVVTKSRRIAELANAVSSLAPRFKLLIVGKGDAVEELKGITSSNPDLVSAFTGPVPYNALGAILSKCDIGFVYYPVNTLNNIYCASNKVYEYASVALPMISNTNPTVQEELKANHIGVSSDNFVEALDELCNDLDGYKKSCMDYTKANPWQNDAALLLKEISGIC